jgi:rSAM/selenodomain-associated transferase 2
MEITVIIPVYNEERLINKILEDLPLKEVEVIVVDGGSTDRTVERAREYPVKIISSRKSRAAQMNAGAMEASGGVLLFLHADCVLGKECFKKIKKIIDDGYIGGCFSQKIDSGKMIYRVIEASGNIRAKLFSIFYGDQAIFVKKDIFRKIGGFKNVELFEDVLLSERMKREGKVTVLKERVLTSPRRWDKQGIVRTTLVYWFFSIMFFTGIAPQRFKKLYVDVR